MVISSHQQPNHSSKLKYFLKQKIGISESAISLGERQSQLEQAPLAIVMWSFGLLNIEQYQKVIDWQHSN